MWRVRFGKKYYEVGKDHFGWLLNGKRKNFEVRRWDDFTYDVFLEGQRFRILLLEELEEGWLRIRIQGKEVCLQVAPSCITAIEPALQKRKAQSRITRLEAPMPGIIKEIRVKQGQQVQKGDPLLILEAMKMENVLKAPDAVKIAAIHVEPNQPVEKAALLITFDV